MRTATVRRDGENYKVDLRVNAKHVLTVNVAPGALCSLIDAMTDVYNADGPPERTVDLDERSER